MVSVAENYKNKVRNQVGNIAVVVALNLGFASFNASILIDVAIMTFLGVLIYVYNSRVASFGIVVFGCIAIYLHLPHFTEASGWRLVSLAWLVISGVMSLYYSVIFHAKNT
ncbi:hypothetical protein [Shewanella seohaensis]|uniref:Uncharacterized protein n=1 Tax=Shewanella seohaensis TaxID=755175 RepID=A0ABV4VQ74_9GAMM